MVSPSVVGYLPHPILKRFISLPTRMANWHFSFEIKSKKGGIQSHPTNYLLSHLDIQQWIWVTYKAFGKLKMDNTCQDLGQLIAGRPWSTTKALWKQHQSAECI